MSDYLLITKLIFKNAFRSDKFGDKTPTVKSSSQKAKTVVAVAFLGLCFLMPVAMFCYFVYIYSQAMALSGAHAEMYGMLLTVSQVMILVFGTASVISVMYRAGDIEFMNQLPVKPNVVFWAKMTFVYVTDAIIGIFMIVPATVFFAVGVREAGASLGAEFYLLLPLAILVAPLVPLLFANLFAVPVVEFSKRFKNKSYASLAMMIVMYVVLITLYVAAMNKFGTMGEDKEGNLIVTDELIKTIVSSGKIFFYNRWLGLSMCGERIALNLLFYVLFVAAVVGVTYLVCATFYRKNAQDCLESGGADRKAAGKISLETESVDKALFKREWKLLLGDVNFAFNTLLSVIMPVVLMALMSFTGIDSVSPEEGEEVFEGLSGMFLTTGMAMFYGLFCVCGIDYAATMAITREGRVFYINKYLPISPERIIAAKVKLADAITAAGSLASGIASVLFMKAEVVDGLLSAVLIFIYSLGFNRLGILRDLKKPNVSWTNPNEAIKKNFYPVVPMFYAMGFAFLQLIFLGLSMGSESQVLPPLVFFGLGAVAASVFAFVNHKRLKANGVKYFDKIEQSA